MLRETSVIAALQMFLVFVVMLAGIRLRLGLGVSILVGSLVLAVLFGLSPWQWLAAIPAALWSEEAVVLCAIIAVILVFSSLYSASGQSQSFMRAVRGQIRSRSLLLVFFPALIGLLPMPGGAIFSAPMVEKAAAELHVSQTDQALINYWFRHIWELAWPLFPGIILASSLAKMPVTRTISYLWPGTLLAIALGWFFILRPALRHVPRLQRLPGEQRDLRDWIGGLPLAVAILGAVLGEWLCAIVFPGRPMEYGVIAAMLLATGTSLLLARARWNDILLAARQDNTLALVGVVAAIFVFKEILHQGRVVDILAENLGGAGALLVMAVLLPFLVGVVSGLTVAFVGATFPLLFGLVHSMGQPQDIPAVLCLGMYAGFAGIMASPMHICYLMTCNYFHQDPARLLPRILVPSLLLIPGGLACYVLL